VRSVGVSLTTRRKKEKMTTMGQGPRYQNDQPV